MLSAFTYLRIFRMEFLEIVCKLVEFSFYILAFERKRSEVKLELHGSRVKLQPTRACKRLPVRNIHNARIYLLCDSCFEHEAVIKRRTAIWMLSCHALFLFKHIQRCC